MTSVAVVGGGPAGSTLAALLAKQEFDVCIYEADHFPRPHIGESLLPATLQALELSGAADAVRACGFTVKHGASMVWGKNNDLWSWYFRETNVVQPYAFQVNRDEFDNILLQHAGNCGAQINQGARVDRVCFDGSQAVGIEVDGTLVEADFVVDASGQSALLATQSDSREWDSEFRNLAVYRYFKGGEHLQGDDSGNILVEAIASGWLWKIPLKNEISSVGVVVDRDHALTQIRESSIEGWFAQQIADSNYTNDLLQDAQPLGSCTAVRDWSYQVNDIAGTRHCLIGDAACFIDPLFSTGVHLAIYSATLAAALVTTTFRNPGIADAARSAFVADYKQQYQHFRELARLFYASNRSVDSYFWEARRITGDDALTPRNAFVQAVSGQAPSGYERTTLWHGALPKSFLEAVESIESQRRIIQSKIDSELSKSTKLNLAPGVSMEPKALFAGTEFAQGLVIQRDGFKDVSISPFVQNVVALLGQSPATIGQLESVLTRNGWGHNIVAEALLPTLHVLLLEQIVLFD